MPEPTPEPVVLLCERCHHQFHTKEITPLCGHCQHAQDQANARERRRI